MALEWMPRWNSGMVEVILWVAHHSQLMHDSAGRKICGNHERDNLGKLKPFKCDLQRGLDPLGSQPLPQLSTWNRQPISTAGGETVGKGKFILWIPIMPMKAEVLRNSAARTQKPSSSYLCRKKATEASFSSRDSTEKKLPDTRVGVHFGKG